MFIIDFNNIRSAKYNGDSIAEIWLGGNRLWIYPSGWDFSNLPVALEPHVDDSTAGWLYLVNLPVTAPSDTSLYSTIEFHTTPKGIADERLRVLVNDDTIMSFYNDYHGYEVSPVEVDIAADETITFNVEVQISDLNRYCVSEFTLKLHELSPESSPIYELYVIYHREPVCYLTTTMVKHYGKEDDGAELTSMRRLRAQYRDKHAELLAEYYEVSPQIIRGIDNSDNPEYWYSIIKDAVDWIVIFVELNEWEQAEHVYLTLYNTLKTTFYEE